MWVSRKSTCLDEFWIIVSITQLSDFWVMTYGNWKHILGVFSFHNSIFNGISVIKHTLMGPLVKSTVTVDSFFFFSLGSVIFFSLFFFFFFFQWVRWVWVLGVEGKKKKKVKAAPSDRYGAYKQLKNIKWWQVSNGAKWVGCRELGYFKWWVISVENWVRIDEWWQKKIQTAPYSLALIVQLFNFCGLRRLYNSSIVVG